MLDIIDKYIYFKHKKLCSISQTLRIYNINSIHVFIVLLFLILQRALAEYNRNSTLKHMVSKIRRDAHFFTRSVCLLYTLLIYPG